MKNRCTKFRNYRPYTAKPLGTWKMFDNPTDNHTDIEVPLYDKLRFHEAKKIAHLFHDTSSFLYIFVAICEFIVALGSGNYQIGEKIWFDLDIDLRPLALSPFAWTSLSTLVITPENCIKITVVTGERTDWRTNGRRDRTFARAA